MTYIFCGVYVIMYIMSQTNTFCDNTHIIIEPPASRGAPRIFSKGAEKKFYHTAASRVRKINLASSRAASIGSGVSQGRGIPPPPLLPMAFGQDAPVNGGLMNIGGLPVCLSACCTSFSHLPSLWGTYCLPVLCSPIGLSASPSTSPLPTVMCAEYPVFFRDVLTIVFFPPSGKY